MTTWAFSWYARILLLQYMRAYFIGITSKLGSTMPDIDLEFDEETGRWGYVPWRPQRKTQALLAHVNAILDLYKPQRPITLRQLFYRMVAQYHYPHTPAWYTSLGTHLTNARRAEMTTNDGVLLFDAIRDDEFIRQDPFFYDDQRDYWNQTRSNAEEFTLDRQEGQQQSLVVWCEGAGMVPQLERITLPFGIPVYSSGKFDGITCKRNLGVEWAELEHAIRVLHLGDHNPSGIHIFEALARDVIRFAEQTAERDGLQEPDITFERIGLLPSQVTDIRPDTPNAKDNRRFNWMALRIDTNGGEEQIDINPRQAWELEALAPDQIERIVRRAISKYQDDDAYREVLQEEQQGRKILSQRLARAEKIMVRGD
jgi:hypothetical protein